MRMPIISRDRWWQKAFGGRLNTVAFDGQGECRHKLNTYPEQSVARSYRHIRRKVDTEPPASRNPQPNFLARSEAHGW